MRAEVLIMERPDRQDMAPADEAPPEQPPVAENICPRCHGSGRADGGECLDCGGTGRVAEGVGGG
jgi:hypothetical protein